MLEVYPEGLIKQLGMKRAPSERIMCRILERIGRFSLFYLSFANTENVV
jgi:hypothetical protein